MRAGDLRHRVTIQAKQATRDAYGAEVVTWGDVATVWAAVEPLAGREFLQAQQVQEAVTTRIRVRYRGDVAYTPEMRASWDGHLYNILSVIEVEGRRRELHLMCEEVS